MKRGGEDLDGNIDDYDPQADYNLYPPEDGAVVPYDNPPALDNIEFIDVPTGQDPLQQNANAGDNAPESQNVDPKGEPVKNLQLKHLEGWWRNSYGSACEVRLDRIKETGFIKKAEIFFDGKTVGMEIRDRQIHFAIIEWELPKVGQFSKRLTWFKTGGDDIITWDKLDGPPDSSTYLNRNRTANNAGPQEQPIVEVTGAGCNFLNGRYKRFGHRNDVWKYRMSKGTSTYEIAREKEQETNRLCWWIYRVGHKETDYYNITSSDDRPPESGWKCNGRIGKNPPPTLIQNDTVKNTSATGVDHYTSSVQPGYSQNDGLPTQPVLIEGQKGICELECRCIDLENEINKFVDMGFDERNGDPVLIFRFSEPKLQVDKGDYLVMINGVDCSKYPTKEEALIDVRKIEAKSVKIRLLKMKYLNTEMIDEDTMKALVDVATLQKTAKSWLKIENGQPTWKMQEKVIFVERNDVLIQVGEINVSHIAKKKEIDDIINQVTGEKVTILLRKEEARQQRIRAKKLDEEKKLEEAFEAKLIWAQEAALTDKPEDGVVRSTLNVVENFDKFDDYLFIPKDQDPPKLRRIRIYFTSTFPIIDTVEVFVTFSGSEWAENTESFYNMKRVEIESIENTNTCFLEMVLPVNAQDEKGKKLKKNMFSAQFHVRIGANHYTLPQTFDFDKHKHGMMCHYKLEYEDVVALMEIMTPDMIQSPGTRELIKLLTEEERWKAKNPNSMVQKNWNEQDPWIQICGLHLADCVPFHKLEQLIAFSSGLNIFRKDIEWRVRTARIEPITRKMEKRKATMMELKELLFWHLVFDLVPKPRQSFDFVCNSLKYAIGGRGTLDGVLAHWANQLGCYVDRWKSRVEDTARASQIRKYEDLQFISVYVNFVNAVAHVAGKKEWKGVRKAFQDELGTMRDSTKMKDQHRLFEKKLFPIDMMLAHVGEKGRVMPCEYIHLERFLGRVDKTQKQGTSDSNYTSTTYNYNVGGSAYSTTTYGTNYGGYGGSNYSGGKDDTTAVQKRKSFWRTLNYMYRKTSQLPDEKLRFRIIDEFCCHWADQMHGIMENCDYYRETAKWMSDRELVQTMVNCLTLRLPETVSTINDDFSMQSFEELVNTYPSLLTANVRKALLENFEIRPTAVMQYAYRENLQKERENTIITGGKTYFDKTLKSYGASLCFELWSMDIGLKDLMISGAVDALKENISDYSGFEVITRFLDNDYVHLLDPKILQVLHDKMSKIKKLDLSTEDQATLVGIVRERLKDANEEKVALWNQILIQVLPINEKTNLSGQIRDICTGLSNSVKMCQDLVASVSKDALPIRIVDFYTYHEKIVQNIHQLCTESTVTMGVLQVLHHYLVEYIALAEPIQDFDKETLHTRMKEFRSLNQDRSLCQVLLTRYVPPTPDFLTMDSQTFVKFGQDVLGKWENREIKTILENPSLKILDHVRDDMRWLKEHEQSIIYKSIWSVGLNSTLRSFQNPVDKRLSDKVVDVLGKQFDEYADAKLHTMDSDNLEKYLQKVIGHVIPKAPQPPPKPAISPKAPEMFPKDTADSEVSEKEDAEDPLKMWEAAMKEYETVLTLFNEKHGQLKAEADTRIQGCLKEALDTALKAVTINDFLSFHLNLEPAELIPLLGRLGKKLTKKQLYMRVQTITLLDGGINEVCGNYHNTNGQYIMKVEPDHEYEIRKIIHEKNNTVCWDIARTDRSGIDEDQRFFQCDVDSYIPPDRSHWNGLSEDFGDAPRVEVHLDSQITKKLCLQTIFNDMLNASKAEIERLDRCLRDGNLLIKDLLIYFDRMERLNYQKINSFLMALFPNCHPNVADDIHSAFMLQKEVSFIQNLCKVAETFGEYSGGEEGSKPENDDGFLQMKKSVDGVKSLIDVADNVKDAAAQYAVIRGQLGAMQFDETQKQWVAHLALNSKVIKDMATETHLKDDSEFANLSELLDANPSGVDAQRSVSLRKVRQLLQKNYIRETFKCTIEVVQKISSIEIKEVDVDHLNTVSQSLEQIARTYNEASGDSLARDKRVLSDALDYGFFELQNPSLVSGLEAVELARKCMELVIDPVMRSGAQQHKQTVLRRRKNKKELFLEELEKREPGKQVKSLEDIEEKRSPVKMAPPAMKRARTGGDKEVSFEDQLLFTIEAKENLGVKFEAFKGVRIRVHDVEEGSLGQKIGFKKGDTLEKINGEMCWEIVSSLEKFNKTECPFNVTISRPNELVPPSLKRQGSYDSMMKRNAKVDPIEVYAQQAKQLESVPRSPGDSLLTATVLARSPSLDTHSNLVTPSKYIEVEKKQVEENDEAAAEEEFSNEKLEYESVESMLDRLLMAILRNDVELKNKTTSLESKFKLVEKICYHRCQYFILGGRSGLIDSKRIFISQSIQSLEAMEENWKNRLRTFIQSTTQLRVKYKWLNYYTVNEVLALNDVLNRTVVPCPPSVKIECSMLDSINGVYTLQNNLVHGRPVYANEGLFLWYNSRGNLWSITEEKDIDTMEVFACVFSMESNPVEVSGGSWTVFSEQDKNFVKNQNVIIIAEEKPPTMEELRLDVLHHLQFAKPNVSSEMVTKEIQNWDILENDDEDLLSIIGRFLDSSLDKVIPEMYRTIPEFAKQICGIEDGKPNLYIADSTKSLSSVLNIFLQRNMVPTASQVLICSKHTTQEEVEILLRRCFDVASVLVGKDREVEAPLFVLAFPENLGNDVLKQVLTICQDYLLSDEAMIKYKTVEYCFAMVSCSRDNKLTQRFLQFERDQTEMSLGEAKVLYKMILCDSEAKYKEAFYKDDIRPFVQVYSSEKVGAGKSFLINRWAQKNAVEAIRIPVNSTDLQPSFIIERLRLHSGAERRAIHFDISSCAGSLVNLFLFKLVILHHISASGLRYQVSSRDAFLVELPTTLTISGDEIEMWGREDATTLNLDNVDSRFYFTAVNAGLPRFQADMDNNPLELGEKEQFVLKYLRAFKLRTRVANGGLRGTGQDVDPDFEPNEAPPVTPDEAVSLLNQYCPDGKDSRILQKCFIDFANSQLVQVHANYFFWNLYSPIPGQIHMREMMLESMVEMAKDFSSRLYVQEKGSLEESTADTRFPLSVRWRSAEVPMILLNQHDVQGYGGDGDISIFCRNLARMNKSCARNWHQIALESRYKLVNFEQEERQRVNQLAREGIVEEGKEGKVKKLDLLLKVVGAPDEAVRATRVAELMERHANYALTFDNMLKMIAIYFRVKAGIPVLLMGETGCGKTKLMEFLSDVLQITLYKCDVHGGFTSDLIIEFMREPIAHAKRSEFMIWVFLDEVNTSPEVGLFKEIICDHSLYGETLPPNLIVLGALNPVRRRKKVSVGLKRKDMAGVETYMNNLVYRVYPLPETMKEYIWNFGALDDLDESQYIGEMLQLAFKTEEDTAIGRVAARFGEKLKKEDMQDLVDCVRITFQRCLVECQKFTRHVNGGEVSVVSLRDVARCINIFSWFLEHYDYSRISHHTVRDQFYTTLQESGVLAIAQCYYYRLGGSRVDFAAKMDTIIAMRVTVTRTEQLPAQDPMNDPRYRQYMENLQGQEREQFHQRYMQRFQHMQQQNTRMVSKLVKHTACVPFQRVIMSEQDRYIRLMEIPKGVATNRSLKENLFMILICVMTRLPIVLVGKPGSSKTLSMIIMRDNLAASTKNKKLNDLGFQDVYLVPFQCSKHSTASAIKDRWDFAADYQKADKNIKVLIFFDEVGLAEQSPYRPLKVFHQLLEHPVISFAGLSNWALDSAKMNRAILHNCPQHSLHDLTDTARAIVESSTDNKAIQDMLQRSLVVIAEIYSLILKHQRIPDFFGARDFYACVQMITARIKMQDTDDLMLDIPPDLFYEAIVRSFGGLEESELRNLLADAMTKANPDKFNDRQEIMNELQAWNGVRALQCNLTQTKTAKDTTTVGAQSRHILVLTDFETSWQVLFDSGIITNLDSVVIFGSHFRQDLNSSVNLYHSINRVKNCIEAGKTVILLHLEDLHDALYDMLNQRYTRIGKRLYCRIAMGAESVICQVHPHFKCIVVGSKLDAYIGKIPVAFLNRFEKQVIDRRQLMNNTQRTAEKLVLQKLNRYRSFGEDSHLKTIDRLFPGFMDETIPSLFSVLLGEQEDLSAMKLCDAALPVMLENAYAEVFAGKEQAFQPFKDLVAALEQKAMEGMMDGMHVLVRTHDRIYASETIEEKFTNSKLEVRVVQLDEFQTELEFSHFVENFAKQEQFNTLIVQCNHKGDNIPLMLHAKHILEERARKQEAEKEKKQKDEDEEMEDKEEAKDVEMKEKDEDVKGKEDELEDKDEELQDKDEILEDKDEKPEVVQEEEEKFEPKIWVMLVHTPRVKRVARSAVGRGAQTRVFPLVFDRIWKSFYVDALIPSDDLGIPGLNEMSRSRIPELLRANPSGVLLRVFRKALTQLRFAQYIKMFEEISSIRELISENPWDGGVFLNLIQSRLLSVLDTDEFKKIISEVVLGRIKEESESQWIRGSFRDRLVTFTDKIFQTSFARQLKLLYEHGNFRLYKKSYFEKLENDQSEYNAQEFREAWVNTVSESRLVTAGKMAITDRPDPIHVPSAYQSRYPFSYTLDAWACSKRAELESILIGADQGQIAEMLCNVILSQRWKVDHRFTSHHLMESLVSDMINNHVKEIFSESAEETLNESMKAIAKSFVFQSAYENRHELTDEQVGDANDEEMEDTSKGAKGAKDEEKSSNRERIELRNQFKSVVSVWDVFPAFWYNTMVIARVLRLFSISEKDVREKISELFEGDASENSELSIANRVGKALKCAVESLSDLLQNATPETIPKVTEQIVASQGAVNSLLQWISDLGALEQSFSEEITRQWRLVQLKLLVSRHIAMDSNQRADMFKVIVEKFADSTMFGTHKGFATIIECSKEMTKSSEEICRVMRRYLELFIFVQPKWEMEMIVYLTDMIDPSADSLLGNAYSLTDVAKVKIATELYKLSGNMVLGADVTSLLNTRLARLKQKDGELASLILVVIEEEVGRSAFDSDAFTFEDSEVVTLDWLHKLAKGKCFLNEYAKTLIRDMAKPEEATLETFGGEKQIEKLFSIISPKGRAFQPLHYYFAKVLCKGGIPWVQELIANEVARKHIVSRAPYFERLEVVAEVDPYVLGGENYTTYRDEFVEVTQDKNRSVNLAAADEETLLPCILALHNSVYRPSTLQGPPEAIGTWMRSPEMGKMLQQNPNGKYIYRLAQNSYAEGSLLKYTAKYDKFSRWVCNLTFHMCGVLSVMKPNHFTMALNDPQKYVKGFMPSMPLDTSEALGNLVGAAAWVCPRGHVYYIGDCTRPWVTAKCHCGADIGGEGHVAQHGNQRLDDKREDRPSEPGYLLLGTEKEVTELKPVRKLDVPTTKILRLLLHSVFLLSNATSVRDKPKDRLGKDPNQAFNRFAYQPAGNQSPQEEPQEVQAEPQAEDAENMDVEAEQAENEAPAENADAAPAGDAPVPAENAEAPAENVDAPAPAPAENVDAPAPAENVDAPAPAENVDAPAPAENVDAPAPAENVDAPAPAENVDAPAPAENVDAPAPAENVDAPAPAENVDAPAPAENVDAPAPAENVDAPAPAENMDAPVLEVVNAEEPAPDAEEPAPDAENAPENMDVEQNEFINEAVENLLQQQFQEQQQQHQPPNPDLFVNENLGGMDRFRQFAGHEEDFVPHEEEQEPAEPDVEPKAVDYSDKSPVAKLMQGHGFGSPLQKYLFNQVTKYLGILQNILGLGAEETVLFLHQVIQRFYDTFHETFPDGLSNLTEESRELFEEYFKTKVVGPLMPPQDAVEELRNEHMATNDLLAEVWEKTNLDSDVGQVFRSTYLPNLMLESQPVHFDNFAMHVCTDHSNKTNFPSLYALATARPSIWVIRYLPALHAWCKLVMQRFNRKLTRDEAKQMTIADVLVQIKEESWGNPEEFQRAWADFVSCWNEIYRLVNIDDHTRLDELQNNCVRIYEVLPKFDEDPSKVKVVFCCPDEDDEGMMINTIVDHLIGIHNRFLTDAGLLVRDARATNANVAPIMKSDSCTTQNLVDVDKDTVNDMIRSHCVRALQFGSKQKLAFDMSALELDIRDRFVLGKGEVRSMLPFFEFAGVAKIEGIFEQTNLPKERLDPDFIKVATAYQSGLDRTHALEVLEETILLLGRLGISPKVEEPLYIFMKDVLKMSRQDYELFNLNETGNEIQLRHLHCLWSFLQKQSIYDDPKRRKVPSKTLPQYMKPLTDDQKKYLDGFIKNISLADFEEVVFEWYSVLLSMGAEKRHVDQKMSDYLGVNLSEKITEGVSEICLECCGSSYEYLAKVFFPLRSDLKFDDEEEENEEMKGDEDEKDETKEETDEDKSKEETLVDKDEERI